MFTFGVVVSAQFPVLEALFFHKSRIRKARTQAMAELRPTLPATKWPTGAALEQLFRLVGRFRLRLLAQFEPEHIGVNAVDFEVRRQFDVVFAQNHGMAAGFETAQVD